MQTRPPNHGSNSDPLAKLVRNNVGLFYYLVSKNVKNVHYTHTTEIDIDFSYNPHLKPDSLIMRVEKYLVIFHNDILMTKVGLCFFHEWNK